MIRLLKLEMKKARLGWYARGALIANAAIIALLLLISYIERVEGGAFFGDIEEAFIVIGLLVRSTFIVFAAVLLAKLVIEEYKNKTIHVMFMYPVSRKKLLAVKLFITMALTFITMVLSNVFVVAVFFAVNAFFQFIPGVITVDMLIQQGISIVTFAFAAAGASLVPLYFGMRKQSVPATIVSSLIIIALIGSHNPDFSIATIIYVPLSFAVIGVILALMTIQKVDKVDVL